ncbi:RICIN domain-containing protein [Flavobacterium sp. Fl-77]|uniref:RICIN domain-containing protein n=1 Tax=Flavobacterium flavipigmentatum TaxID=2893884 RepID=A0AAJ2SIH8_9FLAO|nr:MULTISPECIES: RICIN domain-containing protein [unclassified Flavobacterium]MDX6183112.1 RICIN domain-containing protein [Flavobacterium sp. Fl-33]MDX6186819.1 RICIN domain-containing protein [Flavobacterium sp. Fl-77]UFH40472.1 RICIN domain-containing protein [Flavobacterium sp. F-70]
MIKITPKNQKQTKFKRIMYFIMMISFSIQTIAQTVTPWMTTGDQTKLLQQQANVSFGANSGSNPSTITINPATTYQTMDGFGYTLTEGSCEVISAMAATQQNQLLNDLYNPITGLNASVVRISIAASDLSSSSYSYNETSGDVNMNNFSLNGPDLTYLIPIIKKIQLINPNIKILATPWSAPRWMKTNNSWVGGSLQTQYYAAYAKYFVKYFAAMQAQGISIWGITPQNEPENPYNEPSMLMNSTEQKNFINTQLGPQMAAAGYANIKIIAFDHNCDNTAYPIDVLNNSSYVDGAAFHLYSGSISAMSTVRNATNKNVYFTEQYTGAGGSFSGDFGWHMQNVVIGGANNWAKTLLEWNAANNPSLGPRTPGGCSTCLGAVTVNNSTSYTKNVAYYIIGQISKFVKPGALRISSSSTNGSIVSAGFKNPDGSIALVVYNSGGSANTIRVVSGASAFEYSVPASSAVTFNWSAGNPVVNLPGYYNIISRNSNKGLDVADYSTASGGRIQQYDIANGGGNNQRWKFVPDGNGNHYIIVKSSGLYLATENNSTADGVKVQQRTFSASNEFKWIVTSLGGGYYKIINLNSGKSLDVENVSTANGANIQVWSYTGGLNQQWQLAQVESTAKKVAIEDANASSDFSLYINATNDYLKINTPNSGSGQVEIYSVAGQSVLKRAIDFVEGNETEVEISKLPKGLYVVKVNDSKRSYSKKVMKQ